jgi:hypothetical protein
MKGLMGKSKRLISLVGCLLMAASAMAEVQLFVQDSNGVAVIEYECTAGESIRAFALDVTVDTGQIIGISDFFRGPCTASAQGYGIFPASFRDHISLGPETNIDWNVVGYTPLAVAADSPTGTFPGLNSSGVTLEFGAVWDPNAPETMPASSGTLCCLRLSNRANVSLAANASRGGVLASNPDATLLLNFTGGIVQPPEITKFSLTSGVLTIEFAGGELESSPSVTGPWVGTGNSSGEHVEIGIEGPMKFYRVRSP